jgi:predicted nuclease of predicted toxin-antitoxin system
MVDEPRLFIAIYLDEDITGMLAPALRERGFDAQSTAEAGMLNATDEAQLTYASSRGMALLTGNTAHLARLAKLYSETGQSHAGIILSSEQYGRRNFGELLRLVLRLLNSLTADEMRDCLVYLQQFGEASAGEPAS